VKTPTFSVEVITLPVSDVERALRFYIDQVGFKLDVDYSPNDAFRVVQFTPPAPAARSRSVKDSPTRPSVHSATSISSSQTSRSRGAACSNVGSRSAISGTRHPLEHGMEVSHPGSTPRGETMPASPTSPIRMATAGCYKNGATAMCDVCGSLVISTMRNADQFDPLSPGSCTIVAQMLPNSGSLPNNEATHPNVTY
jgi:hypothetical protein